MDGHAEGFQHRAIRVADPVRQRVQQLESGQVMNSRMAPSCLAVPREPDVQAEVVVALAAAPARPVRDRGVDGHPLTAARAVHDHPGRLVAQHQRVIQRRVADAALVPPVQIRAADADGRDPHQALSRAGHRHRLVRHAQVSDRVQPGSPHLVLRLRRYRVVPPEPEATARLEQRRRSRSPAAPGRDWSASGRVVKQEPGVAKRKVSVAGRAAAGSPPAAGAAACRSWTAAARSAARR